MNINFRVEVARSGIRIFQNFRRNLPLLVIALLILCMPLLAQAPHTGGEANLVLPDLGQATFLGGINGRSLLMGGLGVCALGRHLKGPFAGFDLELDFIARNPAFRRDTKLICRNYERDLVAFHFPFADGHLSARGSDRAT